MLQNTRWLEGPKFLWNTKDHWSNHALAEEEKVKADDLEVKRCKSLAVTTSQVEGFGDISQLFLRFSSWHRLKRFVAIMLRYRKALRRACESRSRGKSTPNQTSVRFISAEEMREAEIKIIKTVQRKSFAAEIGSIRRTENLKRTSPISQLDPILKNQVMCVGERLRNSALPEEERNPTILPKKNHVVGLIIEHYHATSGHSELLEHVLAMLREKFWIVGARVAIKSVIKRCHDCKKRMAPVGEQKMADLPENRVTSDNPPFTNVGVDCFGLFIVKQG